MATRTCPAWGGGASGTSLILRCSSPPVAVSTAARTPWPPAPNPESLSGPERRCDHLLQADRRQRDGGRRADRLNVYAVHGIAAILRLRVHDQGQEIAGRRDGERCDREVGSGDRGGRAGREIGADDLLDRAIALTSLYQVGERAVTQKPGLRLTLLRRPRELALVGAVAVHQPDIAVLVPRGDVGDGLAVRRHRRRGVDRVTRELRQAGAVHVHA